MIQLLSVYDSIEKRGNEMSKPTLNLEPNGLLGHFPSIPHGVKLFLRLGRFQRFLARYRAHRGPSPIRNRMIPMTCEFGGQWLRTMGALLIGRAYAAISAMGRLAVKIGTNFT